MTVVSVAMTAAALFGFSLSHSFWSLCLWAVPYGLGAGSVDASLNNYVALHYKSKHMSWLHCMWGIGATAGPYLMGYALTQGNGWNDGYRYIGIIQIVLTAVLILSLPLWKQNKKKTETKESKRTTLTLKEIIKLPGAKAVMVCCFCYCAVEQTVSLWASSYLTLYKDIPPELAAKFAGMFFIGITVGRGVCGFIAIKLNDTQMIRLGLILIVIGIITMLLPFTHALSLTGLILIGFGCAPIYPCIIHSAPGHFGADKSQAIIGIQMASSYVGTCVMPPLFGIIANHITVALLPYYLLAVSCLMILMHEILTKRCPIVRHTGD